MHYLLAYADNVNVLGWSIHTRKKNTETLVVLSKEMGLEVDVKKTIRLCPETSMQDKIKTQISVITPLKGWNS
jgi:hypothetical protein